MPQIASFTGPIQSLFFGVAASSNVLQPVRAIRTEGMGISETFPRTYIPALNQYVQSGLIEVKATLDFYGIDDMVWNIARGMDLSASVNTAPGNTAYSVLAVFPSTSVARCFYFPLVTTTSPMDTGLYKKRPTDIKIELSGSIDNPSTLLVYRGTISQMASIVGSRFPNLMT